MINRDECSNSSGHIPFNTLQPLYQQLADQLQTAAARVLSSGAYILGAEVEAFESEFAAYYRIPYAIGVANGTDALELSLRAAEIGVGDEVITVSHTAVATVCAIERAGATPVLVDIDPITYTIDPEAVEAAITSRTRAIIAVHLYGNPANLTALSKSAKRNNLLLIEDCAQAHGASQLGQRVGTIGDMAAFSFYPTKNLGANGDGGAILTKDRQFAERLRRLRTYGQTYGQSGQRLSVERGINSRLDEMQAALLRVKLPYLDKHTATRRALASLYTDRMPGKVIVPHSNVDARHVFHLFVIRYAKRDQLREALRQKNIGTAIHYETPVHLHPAYSDLGYRRGSLPTTERVANEVLSLPLYIGLTAANIDTVCHAIALSLEEISDV